MGATYNFGLLADVLAALTNILNVGETEAEDGNGINPYALKFDIEGLPQVLTCQKLIPLVLDKIGSVLKLICEGKPEDVNSWRLHGNEVIERPELKIKTIMARVKTALEKIGDGVRIKMIDDILEHFNRLAPQKE